MPLTGNQFEQLQRAIQSGFNGSDLEQLARFELNARLDNIVSPGPLSQTVFDLIQWAEARGRTEELIRAVRRARPNNQEVQATAKALLPPPPPLPPPRPAGARWTALAAPACERLCWTSSPPAPPWRCWWTMP